MKALMVYVTLD